jgi:hypothetical protein
MMAAQFFQQQHRSTLFHNGSTFLDRSTGLMGDGSTVFSTAARSFVTAAPQHWGNG